MRSESRPRFGNALLAVLGLSLGLPSLPAADPVAAAAARQFQNQIMSQMQQRQMYSFNYSDFSAHEAVPPLPAFIKVFAPNGNSEGMGHLYALAGVNGKPQLTWVEIAGKRYFPEDTDSIRVWDLPGIPKGKNWIFAMAKGRYDAYTFNPGFGVQGYVLHSQDSAGGLDETRWKAPDTLWPGLPQTSQLEAGKGDEVMAIRLANESNYRAGSTQYPNLLTDAESLCKRKKFGEAAALLAKAKAWDPHYPRLDSQIGFCREQQGDIPAALEAYRRALRFAGQDADFREDLEKKISKLEPKPGK